MTTSPPFYSLNHTLTTLTSACSQCTDLEVITDNNSLDAQPTLSYGTDASSSCETLTVTCAGTSGTAQAILLVSAAPWGRPRVGAWGWIMKRSGDVEAGFCL